MRLPSLVLFVVVVGVASASGQTPPGASTEGEALYAGRCASCHDAGVLRAPNRQALSRLSPEAIRAALATGSMRLQGADLTPAQIVVLGRTLGAATTVAASTATNTLDRRPLADDRRYGTLRPSMRVTPVPLPITSTPGDPTRAGWPLTMTVSPALNVSAAKPCLRNDGVAPGPK
jgi:hypothetical protein